MDTKQALNIIYQLIEKTNGEGLFKKLDHLDTVRKAFNVIAETIQNPTNEKTT